MTKNLMPLALAAVFALAAPAAQAANGYTLTELLAPGNAYFEAVGLNSAGQVVGTLYDGGYTWVAGWAAGAATASAQSLNWLGSGRAINEAGHVLLNDTWGGWALATSAGNPLTSLYAQNGWVNALNDQDQATGAISDWSGSYYNMARWNGYSPTNGSPGASYAWGTDINNAGQVVGWSMDWSGNSQSLVWNSDNSSYALAQPNGLWINAVALNDAGVVVGSSIDSSFQTMATVWHDSTASTLGAGEAMDINNAGQVVGYAMVGNRGVAALWQGGQLVDLNTVLDSSLLLRGATLENATDISQNGRILASGRIDGHQAYFVLTPDTPVAAVPEPQTTALLLAGLAAVGGVARRRAPQR